MRRAALTALAVVVVGFAAGCEVPLDPLLPSDLVFSMSGYLDASADTQWVRVEPFGGVTDRPPGPLDAEVDLVLPGGDHQPMAQEVRMFITGPAHLFWTTADVVPGQTYVVVARGADGAEARATVRVPDDRDVTFELLDGPLFCPTGVKVGGPARVVDVEARYALQGPDRAGERFRISKLASVQRGPGGTLDAFVYFGDDALFMEIPGLPLAYPVDAEIVVALGTEDWPDVDGLTLEDAISAADVGHVEGGVGFVGGVVTKRLPFLPGFGRIPPFEGSGIDPLPCEAGLAGGFD